MCKYQKHTFLTLRQLFKKNGHYYIAIYRTLHMKKVMGLTLGNDI